MTLAQAIRRTLAYSDHFSFPLQEAEIYKRLISDKSYTRHQVKNELVTLLVQKKIQKSGLYYYLPGRQKCIKLRQAHTEISHQKITRATKISHLLAHCPTLLGVYVTGSVAVENAKKEDDIDFLIIAKNQRLWITRLWVTLCMELMGVRRHPFAVETKDTVCLNLYLTPEAFVLPESKQSLYAAYELIQALPLYDPQHTQTVLLAKNSWIKRYLPNYLFPKTKMSTVLLQEKQSWLLNHLETLVYHFQAWYMRKKLTTEYISQSAAFFHPTNPGIAVLKKLDQLK